MSPRDVIRRAMDKRRAAALGGCFAPEPDKNSPDACCDGTCACARTVGRDADAILAALAAAPEATRVALARSLLPERLAVVPVEPTVEIIGIIAHPHYPGDNEAGKEVQRRLGCEVVPPRFEYEAAAGQWGRIIAAAREAGDGR
jgi:hypothetical protein